MQITFYCHLYMNENLKKKEAKIKKKLSANKLQPSGLMFMISPP